MYKHKIPPEKENKNTHTHTKWEFFTVYKGLEMQKKVEKDKTQQIAHITMLKYPTEEFKRNKLD